MSEEMLYNKTGIKQRVIQEIIELAMMFLITHHCINITMES